MICHGGELWMLWCTDQFECEFSNGRERGNTNQQWDKGNVIYERVDN